MFSIKIIVLCGRIYFKYNCLFVLLMLSIWIGGVIEEDEDMFND